MNKLTGKVVSTKMNKTIITFGIVGTVLIFGANLAKNEVIASKVAEKYELATEIKAEYQLNETTLTKKIVKNAELDKYKGAWVYLEINISCAHSNDLHGMIARNSEHITRLISSIKDAGVTAPIALKMGHSVKYPF